MGRDTFAGLRFNVHRPHRGYRRISAGDAPTGGFYPRQLFSLLEKSFPRARQLAALACILFSGCALVSGCTGAGPAPNRRIFSDLSTMAEKFDPGPVEAEPGEGLSKAEMLRRIRNIYPDSFMQVHRCVLTFGKETLLLNGYLFVEKPGSFRLLAEGEMGGTLFEIEQTQGKAPVILKNPVNLPPRWLTHRVAGVLQKLYLKIPQGDLLSVRTVTGQPGLFARVPPEGGQLFTFNHRGDRLLSYAEYIKGEESCRIDYGYTGGNSFPSRIGVTHRNPKYQLTIKVINNKKQ